MSLKLFYKKHQLLNMKIKLTLTLMLIQVCTYAQTTWTNEFNDTSITGSLFEIKLTPSNNLLAVGSKTDGVTNFGLIYFYNGTGWTELTNPITGNGVVISSIAPISDTQFYTVSDKRDVHFFDGTNWNDITSNLPDYNSNENFDNRVLSKVLAFSSDNIYVVGLFDNTNGGQSDLELYVAHYDGTSWAKPSVPQSNVLGSDPAGTMIEIDATSANDIWIAKRGYIFSGGYELGIWHFNGTNWTFEGQNLTTFGNLTLRDVDAVAPNDVWFTGSRFNNGNFEACYVHFDGSNYALFTQTATQTNDDRYCIAQLDSNNVWSGINAANEDFTFFDGNDWTFQTTTLSTLSGGIRDMKKLNDCLYAVGFSGSNNPLVLKTCSTPLSVVDLVSTSDLFSFFPNPATNEINLLNFENIEKFIVYDVSGKQLFCIKSLTQKLDIQNLNSGIYFLKVIDNKGRQQTRKMIKK